jgi:hypothetical protein
MSEPIGTVLIKFSESEIQTLINSLHMSITTVVPCVDDGKWKVPYEVLRKELQRMLKQLEEQKWEKRVDGTKEIEYCEPCD